ncbi:MAG: glycosyltransferase family 4 protein [Actinomycetota bacterium]
MNLTVLTPHFHPDVAPTGAVATRIVEELAHRSHDIEVITSLPWYRAHRVEPGFEGRLVRYEDTPWGRIIRINPFPTSDKRNIVRRAASYGLFSLIVAGLGTRPARTAGRSRRRRVDGVLAMSPPLTLGVSGWAIARAKNAPFVFNVQDVFPDVAVELGVLKDRRVVAAARRLERFCYERADAVTVLSEDLKNNVAAKTSASDKVRVIPNFVDTATIAPQDRGNAYRQEFGLHDRTVVMYAGNVGLSQSLGLLVEAAAALAYESDLVFVVNGSGAALPDLIRKAGGLNNIRFIEMQPADRLPEVLAAADIHVVPLKRGLARSSVPSKMYSILAAARPLIASVDEGSEVARVVERSGGGIAVPPEDAEAFTKAIKRLLDAPEEARRMGQAGRAWVEQWASPAAVAAAYEDLFTSLA